MATQICPNCNEDSFTWYIMEDDDKFTTWLCHSCSFKAYEDESLERICLNCKTKTEIQLIVLDKKYWWCNKCLKYELINEK